MKVGTKSVLFGYHQFVIHPLFVAWAWWLVYGFPWDPRLWVAFFVHDIGYWGRANMDGAEGEAHVEVGARVMSWFGLEWRHFTMYHSRFWAKQHGMPPSQLCYADKLAVALYPVWLLKLLYTLSGEAKEYLALAQQPGGYKGDGGKGATMDEWLMSTRQWCRDYLKKEIGYTHKHD